MHSGDTRDLGCRRDGANELQLMVDDLEVNVPGNTSAEAAVIGKNDHDRIPELEEALKVALVERAANTMQDQKLFCVGPDLQW
jgi:hypothetical protein